MDRHGSHRLFRYQRRVNHWALWLLVKPILLIPDEMSGLEPGCSGDKGCLVWPLIKCLEYVTSEAVGSDRAKLFILTFTGDLPPISITWDFYRKLAVGIWPLQLPGNNLAWIANPAWVGSGASRSVLRRFWEKLTWTEQTARNLSPKKPVLSTCETLRYLCCSEKH